jgi:trigger factor
MLEPLLDEGEWSETAAEEIVRYAYPKAVEGESLEVDRTTAPQVSVGEISRTDAKCAFSAKVPLHPKVELGEYKSLPVQQPSAEVSDEEVEHQMEELRKGRSSREAVTDRGMEEGDVSVLNVKVVGEDGEGRSFMTIAGQTFPQLDEAILGMHVEEMKHMELTFPASFQEQDWCGKTLEVQVTVNSLSSVRMPELDDSFAQSFYMENLDELRNRVREAIGRAKQQSVKQLVQERLVDELMNRSTVSVSDNMWENLADRRLTEMAEEQGREGKSLEVYAKDNGMTIEQLRSAWREKAKLEVERALVIQGVYSAESMTVSSEDLNDELHLMAKELEMEPGDLLAEMRKNQTLEELHFRCITRKVGDFLLANADLTIV